MFEGIFKKIIISYLSREEESCKKSAQISQFFITKKILSFLADKNQS